MDHATNIIGLVWGKTLNINTFFTALLVKQKKKHLNHFCKSEK